MTKCLCGRHSRVRGSLVASPGTRPGRVGLASGPAQRTTKAKKRLGYKPSTKTDGQKQLRGLTTRRLYRRWYLRRSLSSLLSTSGCPSQALTWTMARSPEAEVAEAVNATTVRAWLAASGLTIPVNAAALLPQAAAVIATLEVTRFAPATGESTRKWLRIPRSSADHRGACGEPPSGRSSGVIRFNRRLTLASWQMNQINALTPNGRHDKVRRHWPDLPSYK